MTAPNLFKVVAILIWCVTMRCQSCDLYVKDIGVDHSLCLTNPSNSTACKSLQYVLENYLFENDTANTECHIHVYNNQIIDSDDGINVSLPDGIVLYVTGETDPSPIITQNSTFGIFIDSDVYMSGTEIVWSNLDYYGSSSLQNSCLEFEMLSNVTILNAVFEDSARLVIQNVSRVLIDNCSFSGENFALDVEYASNVVVFDTIFIDFVETCFTNVLNVMIDSSLFIYALSHSIVRENNKEMNYQNSSWQFSNSKIISQKNSSSALITFEGVVTTVSIRDSEFVANTVTSVLILNLSQSTILFEFIRNTVGVNTFSNSALELKGLEGCNNDLNTIFQDNKFGFNNGSTQAMITVSMCCASHNLYINNTFGFNRLAALDITSGANSIHNLSTTTFVGNIAVNILVDFELSEKCSNGKMVIDVAELQFNGNSFYLTVDDNIEDPTVLRIKSPGVQPIEVIAGKLDFFENQGTALTLLNAEVTLQDSLNFTKNSGSFGGAMLLDNARLIVTTEVNITFTDNVASYGGAIYILSYPCSIILPDDCQKLNVNFSGNNAIIEGASIYSEQSHCQDGCFYGCAFTFDQDPLIVSGASSMEISADRKKESYPLSAFPGRFVSLNFTIEDCAGTPVSCTAKPLALCGEKDKPYSCRSYATGGFEFEIESPVYIQLIPGWVDTQSSLSIDTQYNDSNYLDPKLYFQCRNHRGYERTSVTGHLNVNIDRNCPKGFVYSNVSHQCNCSDNSNSKYYCDNSTGNVCVEKGHWAGTLLPNQTELIVIPCNSINCNYKNAKKCPLQHLNNYIEVDLSDTNSMDNRCLRGHSGLLCSQCNKGTTNSFDMYQCIENDKCHLWHKFLLLILSIIWPVILGFILLFLLPKTQNGVGSFYCPFFILSVVGTVINGTSFDAFSELRTVVNIYISTFLIGSRALGFVPLCFFDMGGPMWISFYNYLGPIIIFAFLFAIIKSAQVCFKSFSKLQSNPVKSISIALLVTFWSLAYTSITLVTFITLKAELRLKIQPDQLYLHKWHMLVFIVSVIVVASLSGVSILLLFSPVCLGILNRIKPYLDEFHHCYKPRYRWFSGVYFVSWILLSIFHVTTLPVVFNSLLFIILVTHCLCQPYKKAWMNRVDTVLLVDLIVIISLDETSEDPYGLAIVIKYFAVLLPLVYITVGSIFLIGKRLLIIASFCINGCNATNDSNLEVSVANENINLSVRVLKHQSDSSSRNSNDSGSHQSSSTTVATIFESNLNPSRLEREPLLFSEQKRTNGF